MIFKCICHDFYSRLMLTREKLFCSTLGRIGTASERNCYDERVDAKNKRLLGFIWGVHVHKDFCCLFKQDWS